jgi:hypothetical protein
MVSSSFGIVITQLVDTELQVLYANEFQRPDSNNYNIYKIGNPATTKDDEDWADMR